jgi:hypothetical protein
MGLSNRIHDNIGYDHGVMPLPVFDSNNSVLSDTYGVGIIQPNKYYRVSDSQKTIYITGGLCNVYTNDKKVLSSVVSAAITFKPPEQFMLEFLTTISDEYSTNENSATNRIYGLNQRAMGFICTSTTSTNMIKLKINQTTSLGNVSVAIYEANGNNFNPVGSPLAISTVALSAISSTTFDWFMFVFDVLIELYQGTAYVIVVSSDNNGDNQGGIRWATNSVGGSASGHLIVSSNGGATWSYNAYAGFFQIHSSSPITTVTRI